MFGGVLNLLVPLLFIASIVLLTISLGMYFLSRGKNSKENKLKAIKIGILPLIYVIMIIVFFSR